MKSTRTLLLGGLLGALVLCVMGAVYQNYYVTNPNPAISPAGVSVVSAMVDPKIDKLNGSGTNTAIYGGAIHATTALSIPPVLPSTSGAGYYQILLSIPGRTNLYTTTLVFINTTNGVIIGDGSGLTNLSASGTPIINLFVTTNFVTYQYVTNQFVTTNFVNYSYETNTFITTNFVNTSYTTNFFGNKATITTLVVNDGVITNSLHYVESAWVGPTNAVNLSKARWTYATLTPFSITNLFGGTNGMGNPSLLTVSNASSSNVTWTYHPTIASRNGDTLTLTNGHVVKIALDSDFGGSNAVSATFPH